MRGESQQLVAKAYEDYELAIKRFGFLSVERRRAYKKYLILDLAAIKEYRVREASELISILTDNVQANPSNIPDLMDMIIEIGKSEDMEQIKNMWRRFYVHLKKIQDGTIQG